MSTKLVDTECPGCHKKFGTAVDVSEIVIGHEHKAPDAPDYSKEFKEIKEMIKDKEKPAEAKKSETVLQAHVPGYHCGPDCEKIHKNKNHKARPKGRCNTCDQFSNVGKGKCPWCEDGQIEKIDDDDLDTLGILKPDVHGDAE